MPSIEWIIITGLCLWAIALELKLRRSETVRHDMGQVLYLVATGRACATYENNKFTIQLNKGE
jgi:hypothetical protein